MRLIDATRIEQFILNNCSDTEEINTIYAELINAPSIDLVRCGDCKCSKKCIYPAKWNWCPDGERRTDD